MKHVLALSLGPVQDFIATARRCQDLWFGSWLLSDLSRVVAESIRAHDGDDALVFPGRLTDGAAVANEIIAIVSDPVASARSAEEAVRDHLRALAESCFARVEAEHFHREVALEQVSELIEVYSASVGYSGEEGAFATARLRVKALLAARKATRDWPASAPTDGAGVPKSSLDGQRASVIDEAAYDAVARGARSAEWLRRSYFAKPGERLSGVDLLKRVGLDHGQFGAAGRPAFHSTSHIAAGPLRTRLARSGAHDGATARWTEALEGAGVTLDDFRVAPGGRSTADLTDASAGDLSSRVEVPRGGPDGYLWYADRIPELLGGDATDKQRSPDKSSPSDKEQTKPETDLRQELDRLLRGVGWHRPPMPYYAFVLADGDNMGKFITERLPTRTLQQGFSKRLEAWATGTREIIEDHLGSLIYAGGDDVMAIVPLHRALLAARDLAESFADAMERVTVQPGAPDEVAKPTLSVGLAICHHMRPMRDALEVVRAAERRAKEAGRNALAVIVDKRSGPRLEAAGRWDEAQPLDARIAEWVSLFGGEDLPDKTAFVLEETLATLTGFDSAPDAAVDSGPMIASLTRRVVSRRRAERGDQEVDKALAERITKRIEGSDDPAAAVRSLSHELQIARLFLDAHEEAWGAIPGTAHEGGQR